MNTQYINLNMVPSGVLPVMHVSQFDIGRPLGVVVYDGSAEMDLDDYTVTIEATRTDGTAITAAVTTDGNIGAFVTTATMTNKDDLYPAQLVIVDGDSNRVASLPFMMRVVKAAMDENSESIEEDAPLYQQYNAAIQALIVDIRADLNAEVTARQAADTTLQNNINAEASTRATQDAVLSARMDTFASLPDGSTAGDAELLDIRVGADGTTYASAGDAVRGQVSDLKNQLSDNTDTERIGFVQGKFVILSGSTANVNNLTTGTNNSVAVVSCSAGDVFTVSAQGGSASRAWGFVDANGNVLERADASITVDKMVLTAPTGAVYLVINDTQNSGRLSYKGILLISKTDDLIEDSQPLYTSLMEQGGFSTASGYPLILVDSSKKIRTKDFASWASGYCISLKPGFEGRLLVCDADGNYLAVNGWGKNLIKVNVTGGTQAKVEIQKTSGADILPSEVHECYTYSDIPLEAIQSKADATTVNEIDDKVQDLISKSALIEKEVALSSSSGVMATNGTVTSGVGQHAVVSVNAGEMYRLFAQKGSTSYPPYLLFNGSSLVSYGPTEPTGLVRKYLITIPNGVDSMVVNSLDADFIKLTTFVKTESHCKSAWKGKKIAWFGTSIPAKNERNGFVSYPDYVADRLGATMYNEAVPSSMARGGFIASITETDPYGWTGMGYVAAIRNMGSTVTEKQDMIDNWDSKWKALVGGNHDLTNEEKTLALSCSYENKLGQYITDPVDLYVFDHGYNDWNAIPENMEMDENNPYNRATFQGAMNTYIKMIFESNPRAKIVMISHYETDERPGLIAIQEEIANYWNIPFFKLCDRLGWCYSRKITSEGYWKAIGSLGDGVWVPDGGTSTEYRLTEAHIPDGRHPNLDVSGDAIKDIGELIIPFINSIAPAN